MPTSEVNALPMHPEMKRAMNDELAQLNADYAEWMDNPFTIRLIEMCANAVQEYQNNIVNLARSEQSVTKMAGMLECMMSFSSHAAFARVLSNFELRIRRKYPSAPEPELASLHS